MKSGLSCILPSTSTDRAYWKECEGAPGHWGPPPWVWFSLAAASRHGLWPWRGCGRRAKPLGGHGWGAPDYYEIIPARHGAHHHTNLKKKRETGKKNFFWILKFCWIEYDRQTWCLFRKFSRAASLPLLISSFAYLSILASFSLARSKICNQSMRMREFQNPIQVAHATILKHFFDIARPVISAVAILTKIKKNTLYLWKTFEYILSTIWLAQLDQFL